MKLHLPRGLRTAVLSCYAVFAPLTTTLATSTLSVGIVSYTLLQEQACAADVTFTGPSGSVLQELTGWEGTNNVLIFAAGSENAVLNYTGNMGSGVISGMRVDVDGASLVATNDGHRFINGLVADALLDINGNFTIDLASSALTTADQFSRNFSAGPNNITIDIASGKTLTFKADLTGDTGYTTTITGGGTFDYHYSDTANNPGTQHGYNLAITGGTTLNLANDTTTAAGTTNANVLPTGSLSFDSGHLVLIAGEATIGGAVTVGGTGRSSITGATSLAMTGAVTMQDGATLDLGASPTTMTTLSTAGTTAITGTGSLTLTNATIAAGSQLTLQSATTNITGDLGGTGSLIVDAGKTANISGTLTSILTVTNNGTLNWTDVTFDLGAMGITGAGTHSLVNLTGADSGFAALTAANISGFTTAGYTLTFNNNGELVIAQSGAIHTYASSDAIAWSVGTEFEAGKPFATGDTVFFTASPTVTLNENITAAQVVIEADSAVTLQSATAGNTLNAVIDLKGSLVLEGDLLHADARVQNTGTLELNIAGVANYQERLEDFAGTVKLNSGTLYYGGADASTATANYDIEIAQGSIMQMQNFSFDDTDNDPSVTLQGGTLDTERATLRANNTQFYGQLTANNYSEINSTYQIYLHGGLAGSGTLYLTGGDAAWGVYLRSNATHTGTLDVTGGTFGYGNAEGNAYTNAFERIIIRSGAEMYFQNAAVDFNTIQMDGGTINVYDMNTATANIARMEVSANSTITHRYNNQWKIAELTTTTDDVTLSFTVNVNPDAELMQLELASIVDYDGVIDFGRVDETAVDQRAVTVGTIEQSAGKELVIQNLSENLLADDFVVKGEGRVTLETGVGLAANSIMLEHNGTFESKGAIATDSFRAAGTGTSTLTSLTINEGGSLYMRSSATVTIAELSLGADKASLVYDSIANPLLDITNWAETTATLDIFILDIAEELKTAGAYDLGIGAGVDETLINVIGYTAGTDYTLDNSSGSWVLTLDAAATADLDWDIQWGTRVIAMAPTTIPEKSDLTGFVGLYNTPADYTAGPNTSVLLTGGGDAETHIFGGVSSTTGAAAVTTNTWIKVTGGTFKLIAGGNFADNWAGGAICHFTGDTHILTEGGTINTIVGANYKEAQGAGFTGDTYISVKDGTTLQGSVIGGIGMTHSADPTLTGNTHIFVNTVLNDTSGSQLFNSVALRDAIIGGNAWVTNVGSDSTLLGNTNINVDLSESTSAETSFNRFLIGGSTTHSYNNSVSGAGSAQMTGDTHITIEGKAGVTFTRDIIGGHYAYAGNVFLTLDGDTNITINGADTNIDANIYGGHMNLSLGYNSTMTGRSNIIINDGTIGSDANDRLVGGASVDGTPAPGAQSQGGASIQLLGGTINSSVYGGHYINKSTTPLLNEERVSIGDIAIEVDGATVLGDIVGGSSLNANANQMVQGNISVNLLNGSVGSVYAAGHQLGAASMATANTTVAIATGMDFSDAATISGGYKGTATGSTVTGERALSFLGNGYDAATLDKVSFVDFNTVYVSHSKASVTLNDESISDLDATLVTKKGAGTLVLGAAQSTGSIAIEKGTLQLAQSSTLTNISIGEGNLNLGTSDLTVNGDMRFSGVYIYSSLTMDLGHAGIALGASGSFGREDAGNKLALTLNGWTAGDDVTQVLVSGIVDFADLANITGFTTLASGDKGIAAGDILGTLNGAALGDDFFIIQQGDSLVLTNVLSQDLYWVGGGADSVWDTTEAADWHKDSATGADTAFIQNDNVFFTAGPTITSIDVTSAITVMDMTVDGATYTFNPSNHSASIQVNGDLSVIGAGASLTSAVAMDLSKSDVIIATGNTLALTHTNAITIQSLDNAGTFTAESDLTIGAVTNGGTLRTTGDVDLSTITDMVTFTELDADTVDAEYLNIGNGSVIDDLHSTIELVSSGTVQVGGIRDSLTSLENTGAFTINSYLTVTNFSNTGSVSLVTLPGAVVNSVLDISEEVSQGGIVSAHSIILRGRENQFDQVTTTDVFKLTNSGKQVIVGTEDDGSAGFIASASSVGSLEGKNFSLTLKGSSSSFTVTTTEATSLVKISGAGSLSTGGDLALTGSESNAIGALDVTGSLTTSASLDVTGALSVGSALTTGGVLTAASLKASSMTLRGDLIVTGDIDASSLTSITVDYSLATLLPDLAPASQPVIAANKFDFGGSAAALEFLIDNESLLSTGLTDGDSYILADLNDGSNILDANLLLNGSNSTLVGTALFTIKKNGENIVLEMTRQGNNWIVADGNGAWSDATNWQGGFSPSSPGSNEAEAILGGSFATPIEITLGADETASNVLVETQNTTSKYILTGGGKLSTDSLEITKGILSLQGATVELTEGATIDALVVIGAEGTLELDSTSTLTAKTLNYNTGGVVNNRGALTVDSFNAAGASITNSGTLTLGHGSTIGTVADTAGTVATMDGATANVTTLVNEHLDLGEGSRLLVEDNVNLASMRGTGTIHVTSATGELRVKNGSASIISGGVIASKLTMGADAYSTFTALNVDTILIDGDLNTLVSTITSGSLATLSGAGQVKLDITTDSLNNAVTTAQTAGTSTTYYIYQQEGAQWSNFDLSLIASDIYTHVEAGMDVLLTKDGTDKLTLTIQESTDRTWNTADNFAATAEEDNQLSILSPILNAEGRMDSLNVLDTVDKVIVSQDSTIDISHLGAGTLTVSNLWSAEGTTLDIIGSGSNEVKLSNSAYSEALGDINAKDVTLSVESLGVDAQLSAGALELDNSILDATSAAITVSQLSNTDTAGSAVKGLVNIDGSGGTYTGAYEDATINFKTGADQILKAGDGLTITGSAGRAELSDAAGAQMDAIQTTGTNVVIDLRDAASDQGLTLTEASAMKGGTLTILLNEENVEAGEKQQVISSGSQQLTLTPDTNLMLQLDSSVDLLTLAAGSTSGIELIEISEGLTLSGSQIDLGTTLSKYFADLSYDAATGIISANINTEVYVKNALSGNGRAGYEMVTDALINFNPQSNAADYPDLAEAMTALDQLIASNPVAADQLAASIAGASNLGLGLAVSDDMSRQLGSIRNRTMSMGVDPSVEFTEDKQYRGWINAESSSSDLSGEGTLAGYEMSSWGGTVGVEVNMNSRLTIGLALSSMYGDFSSHDVDSLRGDVNTNYLSGFARLNDGRWSHSFVIAGGLSDISTNRTVSYAGGSYTTDGDTEGSSFGMLYELAYTHALNEDSSTAWQPLVSLAFQSSQVDAYTEGGSDAALHVGEQSMTYATLGLGARMETVIGENLYNRSSILSLRAMAKADFGDDSTESDVALLKGTQGSNVKSAERGMFGLEVGVGLNIPIMQDASSIFLDANFEMRENQNSFSASAGYRFAF